MATLSERANAVLSAVVTEFIATGEPVGSRTLTKKYGFALSPATIRNELKDLEDAGFVHQPHTSAGRVPTEKAFRVFIDALMRVRELADDDAARIRRLYAELPPGANLLREAGKLLSELSGVPAIISQSRSETRTVRTLRFIQTRPGELLSVIVLTDGTVENRFITTDEAIESSQLERVHSLLDEVTKGRTLRAIREHLNHRAEAQRDELEGLQRLGSSLLEAAITDVDRTQEVVVEGATRLLESATGLDPGRVRDLMLALEDTSHLVGLLDLAMTSPDVQVFLGQQTVDVFGSPVSVVAAPYGSSPAMGLGARSQGAVGVVGPTRMDYQFLVPLVGATARAMTGAFSESDGPESEPAASGEALPPVEGGSWDDSSQD